MIIGFVIGLLFGFILKRSRLCFTGSLRDIYLEKRATGIYIVLIIILVQSLIYFALTEMGIIPAVQYKPFSLIATALGSLLFGLGCVLAHGCITISFIKIGDGRLVGIFSLLSFAIFASASRQGFLKSTTMQVQSYLSVQDGLVTHLPFSIFIIIVPLLMVIAYLAIKDYQQNKLKLPSCYKGLRHLFFEKTWDVRFAALLLGLLAGAAWYFKGALGITGNVVSWVNFAINGNASGISWGSYFLVGLVVGALICSLGSLEFNFKTADSRTIILALLGGLCMGVGSVWAQGCILGNGLIGTATFSVKAWYSLVFITVGIWVGAYVLYKRSAYR